MPTLNSPSDYQEARKWLISFLSKDKDVVSIYEYGTVKDPGISDLDIMVVLKDRPDRKDFSGLLTVDNVPERFSFLLNNDYKFISKEHFREIDVFGKFRTKLLHGELIKRNQIPQRYARLYEIASVMDFMPERILSILEVKMSKKILVIYVLGLLNSYLYTVKSVETIIGKKTSEMLDFEIELKDLRNTWFQHDPDLRLNKISSLMERSVVLGFKVIAELTFYLISKKYYQPMQCVEGSRFFINQNKGYCFFFNGNDISAEKCFCPNEQKGIFILVPSIWLSHYYIYSKCNGRISKTISNNLILKGGPDEESVGPVMAKVLSKRINLCNEMAEYFENYEIPLNRLHRFAHIKRISVNN